MKKKVLPISLTQEQYRHISLIAITTGESMSAQIRKLINKDIKANKNE